MCVLLIFVDFDESESQLESQIARTSQNRKIITTFAKIENRSDSVVLRWKVDLGNSQKITKIKITNRGDCCGTRMNGFSVLVDGRTCASNVRINQGQTKEVPCSATGRNVQVSLPNKPYLMVCEFGVFAGGSGQACTDTLYRGPGDT